VIDPRLARAFEAANGFPLAPHCCLLGMIGSHSHGTYLPPTDPHAVDDVDFMGIVIPPAELVLGTKEWDGWNWQFEELDVVFYSLRKAVRLLLKANPNILGLLWLRPGDYVHTNTHGASLLALRDAFQSREAYPAFVGYAHGQLKRMTAFDEARMNEYEIMTRQIQDDIGVTIEEVLRADHQKLAHLSGGDDHILATLQSFRSLHKQHFAGYQGAKRKAIVRTHGYDTKNAAHLIRLLRMGVEYLSTGRLQVFRTTDAEELKAIKRGAWSLAQIQEEAERLFAAAEAAQQSSPLPAVADIARVDAWLVRTMADAMVTGQSLASGVPSAHRGIT
jgi:predicted nucleotidyltransferase